jgi:hypothetical protein
VYLLASLRHVGDRDCQSQPPRNDAKKALEIREEGDDDMLMIRFVVAKHGNSHRPDVSSYNVGFCDDLGNVMRLFCEQHGLAQVNVEDEAHADAADAAAVPAASAGA